MFKLYRNMCRRLHKLYVLHRHMHQLHQLYGNLHKLLRFMYRKLCSIFKLFGKL